MVGVSACPGRDAWQRFLLGLLAEAETATLERHLSGCGRCLGTVQALRPRDGFVDTVRAGGKAGGAPTDEADPALMERLCRLCGETHGGETPSAANTPPPPRPGSPDREETAEPYDFLAPPRGPGEIGRLGHYRVLKVLGAGGMGVVFQAEDEQLRRLVALKVMRPALAAKATARERFLREVRAVAAVKHDHVVTIHQVGEDRDVPFLAMELVEGETLEERLRRQGRLPLAEVLRIGREAAEGLAAAHGRGLIHRDVKPSNIWLEGPPHPRPLSPEAGARGENLPPSPPLGGEGSGVRGGRVKLLDFGLARPVGGDVNLTGSGIIVGTPAYMAPEQARGAEVDARCDLFGLGCVLYRLATGAGPFQGADTLATLLALANDTPRPLRALNPEAPAALERVVTRLLAKRPEERYASAREAAAALQAVEADLGRPTRPVARRRRFILAILVLLALLGPLAYLFGPTVVRVATNKGELVIESDDRDVTVTVTPAGQGQKETVTIAARGQRSLTLTAGDYELEVQQAGGLHFTTTKPVTLTRGGREVVRVALVLAQARPVQSLSDPSRSMSVQATVTVAAPQAPENPPPAVPLPFLGKVEVLRSGRRGKPAALRLTFSAALDPASARNLGHYVVLVGFKGKGKKRRPLTVRLLGAVHDPVQFAVTLGLGRIKKPRGQLQVTGVTDSSGAPFDAARDGVSGGTAVVPVDLRPRRQRGRPR
jgi:serine/threonine protein kinase